MKSVKVISKLLSNALNTDLNNIQAIQFVMPPSRNPVWYCRVAGYPAPIYFKLQSRELLSFSVTEEAEVLTLLKDIRIMVPRIITSGVMGKDSYLITSELPGRPNTCPSGGARRVFFKEVISWLSLFQAQIQILPLLEKRLRRYVGWYAPNFDPILFATGEVKRLSAYLGRQAAREIECQLGILSLHSRGAPAREVIHGSIAQHNLLTDGDRLSGVIDFEGTRIGDLMFDVAGYGINLFDTQGPVAARLWFKVCKDTYGEERICYWAQGFIIALLLSRITTTKKAKSLLYIREMFSLCN